LTFIISNKWEYPKCTISEFFVEVLGDDRKPKFWNSSNKEIYLLACLNASSDLKQELQGEVNNIGDASESLLKSTAILSHQILGEKLLNNAANKLQTKTIKTLQSAKAITLTFDSWKNVVDISSERSSMEATIKLVKNLLIEDELNDVKIIAVVMDSSSGYAAANLCIVDIFKSLQSFFTTIKQAVVVTTFFNKSLFFTTLLKNTCNNIKIPYFAFTNPTETW
ncbi:26204_t:CDS:2, partial [Dentiscutata erythropus]